MGWPVLCVHHHHFFSPGLIILDCSRNRSVPTRLRHRVQRSICGACNLATRTWRRESFWSALWRHWSRVPEQEVGQADVHADLLWYVRKWQLREQADTKQSSLLLVSFCSGFHRQETCQCYSEARSSLASH